MLKERSLKLSKIISSWVRSAEPKMSIEQFCEEFYNNFIFFCTKNYPEDTHKVFWDQIFDSIIRTDDTFQYADSNVFACEMTALHVELFGLAWMHHFRLEKYHGLEEKYMLGEIAFTKSYMECNGYNNIWNIMSSYNKTIADAFLHPCTRAIDRDFAPLTAIKDVLHSYVMHRKFTKKIRDNVGDWKKKVELDCATRIANRLSKREDWGGCPISLMLTKKFAERLGWKVDLGDVGFAGFEAFLNRLYNDSKQTIESVTIK